MVLPYNLRCLDFAEDRLKETTCIEININQGPEKRVFLILDLSDSCTTILDVLKKLGWLWLQFPLQWRVTLFALSRQDPLYTCSNTLVIRDLDSFLRELEGSRQWDDWRTMQSNRGSFLQPTLDGIDEMFQSERAIDDNSPSKAIILLLSDGDLLDPDPVCLPDGMSIISILCPNQGKSWDTKGMNFQKIPMMGLGSTELQDCILKEIHPGMEACEIVANFPIAIKENDRVILTTRNKISWEFSKGPLILEIGNSYLGRSDAYIECRSKSYPSTKFTMDSITKFPNQRSSEWKNASIGSGAFFLVDDQSVVHQILTDCRLSSSQRGQLSAQSMVTVLTITNTPTKLDNSIIVFVSQESAETHGGNNLSYKDGKKIFLLIGILLKNPESPFYMESAKVASKDLGIVPKDKLLIQYDQDAARWHMFFGDNRTTLSPRGCWPLPGIFLNVSGDECEAYYSGPLTYANKLP